MNKKKCFLIFLLMIFLPHVLEARRIRTPSVLVITDCWLIDSPKGEILLTDKVWGGHIRRKHPSVQFDQIVSTLNNPDFFKRIEGGFIFQRKFTRVLWVVVRNNKVVTAYFK